MTDRPSKASHVIAGIAGIVTTSLVVWGLLSGWIGQRVGDTAQARARIEIVFGARNVLCDKIRSTLEFEEWVCKGRYLGVDGVRFWASLGFFPKRSLGVGFGDTPM